MDTSSLAPSNPDDHTPEGTQKPFSWWSQVRTLWAHSADLLFGYDYFIAHRSIDGKKYAAALHRALTEKGNELDCFLDVRHYGAGGLLRAMQTRALKSTTRLVVLVTKRAHDRDSYVLKEVAEFKRLHPEGQVVPIATRRECGATWNGPQSPLMDLLPPYPDAIWVVEDPAAIRGGRVSAHVVSKLLTDFTEVRRSSLRQRWLKGAVTLLAVLALSATTAACYAFQQRSIARESFSAAHKAADSLVLDIASGLRNVEGMRVESVKKILGRAEATFDVLQARVPGNLELLRSKAVMYHEFVPTYLVVGDTDSSLKAAESALLLSEELIKRRPDNISYARTHCMSLMKLGDAQVETGDHLRARASYERSLTLRRDILRRQPEDPVSHRDVSVSLMRLTEVDEGEGNLVMMEKHLMESIAIRRKLAQDSTAGAVDLVVGLVRQVDLAIARDLGDEAERALQEIETLSSGLMRDDPSNTRHARNYAIARQRLGNHFLARRDYVLAEDNFQKSQDIFTKLSQMDPGNLELKSDLAISLLKLARAAKGLQNPELTRQRLRAAAAEWRVIVGANGDVYQWQKDLAETLLELTRMETAGVRRELLTQAQTILTALNSKSPLGKEQLDWLKEINEGLAAEAR